jgi:hypothetical protein
MQRIPRRKALQPFGSAPVAAVIAWTSAETEAAQAQTRQQGVRPRNAAYLSSQSFSRGMSMPLSRC